METFCVHVVGKVFLKSSALTVIEVKVLKLLSKTINFALKKLMGKYNWTTLMYTIIRSNQTHNCLYVMLTTLTFSSNKKKDFFIERIVKNLKFWEDCVAKSKHLFLTGILPELIGKWYTQSDKIYAISFGTSKL